MLKHLRILGGLAAICCLAACAPSQVPPSLLTGSHSIGVISGLGDSIHFARSGMTVFGNATSEGQIADWQVDDRILARAKTDLQSRFEVIVQRGDPAALRDTSMPPNGLLDDNIRAAMETALGPNRPKVDLWIAIAEACANGGNYSGPVPCGVSVARPEGMFSTPSAWATIYATVTVFDGATLKPLAQNALLISGRPCYALPQGDLLLSMADPACSPAEELGTDYALNSWDQYNAAQRERIRAAITGLLEPSLDYTLRRLKFVN